MSSRLAESLLSSPCSRRCNFVKSRCAASRILATEIENRAVLDFAGPVAIGFDGQERSDDSIKREDVGAIGAWDWGPMLAAHAMWRELGLDTMLDKRAGCARRDGAGLSDRALVLVANGLGEPG